MFWPRKTVKSDARMEYMSLLGGSTVHPAKEYLIQCGMSDRVEQGVSG